MTKRTTKILIIGLLTVTGLTFGYYKIDKFIKIDSCLDNGGRWNHETNECENEAVNIQVEKIILGTWTTKTGDMTLIIKEDKIADTEYFGSFKYSIKEDSITIFYDTPVKYRLVVNNSNRLVLQSTDENREYYKEN